MISMMVDSQWRYHMEATPSSVSGSNISAANDDVWFKFNAAKNVYRDNHL